MATAPSWAGTGGTVVGAEGKVEGDSLRGREARGGGQAEAWG